MPELKKRIFLFFFINIIVLNTNLFSQEVPQSVNNKGIYEFLDELANNQIITINSAVKPYSRLFISQRLKEAEEKKEQLNPRQQKELDFYLMDFGKELNEERHNGTKAQRRNGQEDQRRDLFYYKDSLFSLTINPILGGEIFTQLLRKSNLLAQRGRGKGIYSEVGILCFPAR